MRASRAKGGPRASGSGPGLRRGPIQAEARAAPWPCVTGSHAGGRREAEEKQRRPQAAEPGLVPAPPASPDGARAPRRPRPARWTSKPPGQGRPRGRRPPLPPARRRPPSRPPPAWRAAPATARAAGGARNGARLAASPRGGECGSPGARRPWARGPRNGLLGQPQARGPRQPGREGGREDEERSRRGLPGPGLWLGSEP